MGSNNQSNQKPQILTAQQRPAGRPMESVMTVQSYLNDALELS